jgi:hypothetical protein
MKYLNPKGVIIMHDCNPLHAAFETPVKNSIDEVLEKAKRGEIPGWTNVWNGDVWKALVHLRVKYPNLEIFTLDLDWGLGIIGNVPGNYDLLEFDARQIAKMNFNDLEANRVRLLNLKPPSYLNIFLEKL